jgi:putative flippase GtrA
VSGKARLIQAAKYLAVQLLAYCVDWAVFLALFKVSGAAFFSNLAAKCAALILAFILHRNFTFNASRGNSIEQAVSYFSLGVSVSIASSFLLVLFSRFMPEAAAKLISDVILIFATFLISKLFIFRSR